MKKPFLNLTTLTFVLVVLLAGQQVVLAQCNNADFEDGTLNGWTGTYGNGTCTGTINGSGQCSACYTPDPFQHNSLRQGPNNQPANGTAGYNHFIMTSGYDPIAGGTNLPVVYSPGSYSVRIGDAHANDNGQHGGGESVQYRFTVTPNNCNFVYHYAVVLKDGGHSLGQQPYFKIGMTDGNNNTINCATFDVNATTAQSIGGFVTVGSISYKTWSTVFIPLNNYIGQTVTIKFTTRDCAPNGCEGSHFAYAYIDAECGPLEIASTSPTICNGQTVTLTAPDGAATYSWSGPGIVSGANARQCVVNMAGNYTVNMTTIATVPCNFSLSTTIAVSANSLVANFSSGSSCAGNPTTFTDISTPVGSATTWAWDFNNDGTTDAITQNPTYTFSTPGTYPVRLQIGSPPCVDDTIINVVVSAIPVSSFTATSPVCEGANAAVTYTGTAPSNATYNWNFAGGTIVSGSGRGPYQINWSGSGTKNVTLTVTLNGCTSPLTTVPVTVNPIPVVSVSPDVSICTGESTSLIASGANTYGWTPATGLSGTTGANVTATPATTSTYTVTGTSLGCSASASVTVTVKPIPTSSFTATSPVCTGVNSVITYTGTAPSNATYSWNFAGGTIVSGSGQGPYQVNWSGSGTKNITLTVTLNGCTSPVTTVPVIVNPIPVVTVSPDIAICAGENTLLTTSGANSYSWTPATGLSSTTGANVTSTPATTSTYTVTGTSLGCSASALVTVTVKPMPTSSFTTTSPVCEGVNSIITYTGTAPSNAAYNWNFDGGTIVSGSGQGPYQVNWSGSGTKNITLAVTLNGCASSLTTVPVTVNPIPVVSVSPDIAICAGENTLLTASGANNYSWTPVAGLNSSAVSNVTATPTGTTTYVVTGTSLGCSSSASVTVTVNPIPVVVISPDVAVCAGESTVLTSSGANSYNWSPSLGLNGTAGTSVTATPSATTTYSVTGTSLGCSATALVTVTVKPMPTSTFTATPTLCAGVNSVITYTGTAPSNATYSWNFAGGTIVSGSGQGPYQVSWVNSGTKNITLTVTLNGCTSPLTTVPVIVNPIPAVTVSPDVAICAGWGTVLNASGAVSYSWSPATGLSDTAGASLIAIPPTTTTYSVTGTSLGCSATASVTVTLKSIPTSPFITTSPVCEGLNAAITYTGTAASNADYDWNFAGGVIVSGSGPGPYQVNWSTSGTKDITLAVTLNGCTSPLTTVPVIVNPTPLVTVSPDAAVCTGESTSLTASGANSYNWTPTAGLSSTTTASVTAAPAATNTYTVIGTSLGCSASASVTVTVNPIPVVVVSPNVAICAGESTVLTASGANSYSWSPSFSLNSSVGASVTATPTSTTTYSVTGTSLGCSATASVTVTVKPIPASSFTATSPVCAGANSVITYTGTAPSNAAYSWNFAGGTIVSGSGQGPYQVKWSTGGTKNITLTVTVNGCTSPVTTVPVTVNPIPVVSVSPNAAVCAGGSTVLTASGAGSYSWSPALGLSGTTGTTLTSAPTATTTYTVTGTSLGCSASASVTVTVKPIPTSSFTAISPVCAGINSVITYTGTAPSNAMYNWNFAGGTIVSGSGQGPYQVKWSTGGTKNITLTVTVNGCTSPVTTVPVTVNPTPLVSVSPNVAICAGESTLLTASGANSYSWTPATGLSGTTGANVTATPAATTTYTVTGTSLGCSASASVTVTVKPIPTSAFTATSTVCARVNSVITYTGTAPSNATYNWNFAGGTVVSGSGRGPYQVNWSGSGTKNITLTVTLNGCTSPVTAVPVTVNPIPVVTVSPDVAICAGESAVITAAGTASYSWTPSAGLNNNTTASVTATPAATTTYTVTGTTAGCSASAMVTIHVTPVPVAAFNVMAGQCLTGNRFNFQAGGTFLPSATFNWSFGPDANPATSLAQNPQVSFASVGNNTISLTITQNGCVSNTYTGTADVYPMPVANFSADTFLGCQHLPVCFTDNSTGAGPLLYQWNFGDGQTSVLQNPCHTYNAAGNFNVQLQVTSVNGCKDDSLVPGMINIIANPIAAFTLSSTTIQLPATTVELTNTSQHAVAYQWLFGDSTGTSTVENPGILSYTEPGYYPVTLYAYNQLGCVDSAQKAVTVYQEEVLFVPNAFTPNGDGNNDYFEIYGKKDGWKQIEVQVFDRWGEKVYESNDLNFKWDGTYKGENMMGAVFVYLLRIVYTNNHADKLHKGSLTLVR